jgi:O-acetyl-ADP-ribose deacetylase
MTKISLNLIDVFGITPHTLNVDKGIEISRLSQLLSEEIGITAVEKLVGGIFRRERSLPVLYDPKFGVLMPDHSLSSYDHIKTGSSINFYFFPETGLTIQKIYLDENKALDKVAMLVTIEWNGAYFPVILPNQTNEDTPLINFIFLQILPIIGFQNIPRGWQRANWELRNTRTGEMLSGKINGKVTEKIKHGDFLQLSHKRIDDQVNIVILENDDEGERATDNTLGNNILDEIIIQPSSPIKVNECVLQSLQADITMQDTEVIVNAAKLELNGGGGVDGAIHRTAGPDLERASKILAPCHPGSAVLTPGFGLQAKWIIHTVGPQYQDGKQGECEVLASAYRSCLIIALKSGFTSITFPAISTGIYGYPKDAATEIAWDTIAQVLKENKDISLKLVRVASLNDETYDSLNKALGKLII